MLIVHDKDYSFFMHDSVVVQAAGGRGAVGLSAL